MKDRTQEVEENTENARKLLAELTEVFREVEQQRATESNLPTPPPPSVKLSDNNDAGYELELSGNQAYPTADAGTEQEVIQDKNLKHNTEIAIPLVYAEECLNILPEINPVPRELNVDQYLKEKERNSTPLPNQRVKLANSYRQRVFQRTFSRHSVDQEATEETVQSLSIEGRGSRGAREAMRTAGTVPSAARSASHGKMLQKQSEMLKRAPTTASKTSPSIPTPNNVHTPHIKQPFKGKTFSLELESHARKDKNPKDFMEKGTFYLNIKFHILVPVLLRHLTNVNLLPQASPLKCKTQSNNNAGKYFSLPYF